MLAEKIVRFYTSLSPPNSLPEGISTLNPYTSAETIEYVRQFYHKYFSDSNPRTILLGINPGRFGGGITGIPFTDPKQLASKCGIENKLERRPELSSSFIYDMIEAFGDPTEFYKYFFLSAVCPIGFIKDGKNINYYDDSTLQNDWEEFIVKTLRQQIELCGNSKVCFSLGQGKNIKFLNYLNEKHQLFGSILPLPHPRWIMQYRLKRKKEFIDQYYQLLSGYTGYMGA